MIPMRMHRFPLECAGTGDTAWLRETPRTGAGQRHVRGGGGAGAYARAGAPLTWRNAFGRGFPIVNRVSKERFMDKTLVVAYAYAGMKRRRNRP
jgi:hypothetical protein